MAYRVLSPEGIKTLIVYQDLDESHSEDCNYPSPSHVPSLHEVRRALDLLYELQVRRRSRQEVLHLQIEFAKLVFGDVGRALLNTLVDYCMSSPFLSALTICQLTSALSDAPNEIADFRREVLLTPSGKLVPLQSPVGSSRSAVDVIVGFYDQIFGSGARSGSSLADQAQEQTSSAKLLKDRDARIESLFSNEPLLPSLVPFAIYPPV